eukprot:scaffold1007_cov324-Pavlova_lutheri.AAC.9
MAPIKEVDVEDGEEKIKIQPLDEEDIVLLKTYGLGPYAEAIRNVEQELKDKAQRVNDLCGACDAKPANGNQKDEEKGDGTDGAREEADTQDRGETRRKGVLGTQRGTKRYTPTCTGGS